MELPSTNTFVTCDSVLHNKLETLVKGVMEEYHNKIKDIEDKNKKRQKKILKGRKDSICNFIYIIIEV